MSMARTRVLRRHGQQRSATDALSGGGDEAGFASSLRMVLSLFPTVEAAHILGKQGVALSAIQTFKKAMSCVDPSSIASAFQKNRMIAAPDQPIRSEDLGKRVKNAVVKGRIHALRC